MKIQVCSFYSLLQLQDLRIKKQVGSLLGLLFIKVLVLLSCPVLAQDESQWKAAAYSKEWIRLLHYRSTLRGYRSELDGKGFFFSTNGKTDPLAELQATAEALKQDLQVGFFKVHPQCAFPERLRFIRENLKIDYRAVACPQLEEFLNKFDGARSTSVIFSSSYPNNPASMFGHTFMKIRSSKKNVLLDVGVNFAALTPADYQMAEYIYRGLFGGYRGVWSIEPYYKKVNEYVNAESRDIWEYELSMTPAETRRLLLHLWELETNSHFDYFFFDENCSYQILRALEAIRLDWTLTGGEFYVIPGETIKRLTQQPGAVVDVSYRPSLFKQLSFSYEHLNREEREDFKALTKTGMAKSGAPSSQTLDASLLSYLYLKSKKKKEWSAEDQQRENSVINLRAANKNPPLAFMPSSGDLKTRPDLGHDASSFHLTVGRLEADHFSAGLLGKIKLRSSYHDLLSPDVGYSKFSEVEFPFIEFQWFDDGVQLQQLGIVNVTSLFPLVDFDRSPSWRIQWNISRERGLDCQNCLIPTFEGGYGVAFGPSRIRYYGLGLAKIDFHHELKHGYRARPGLELGLVWSGAEFYKLKLTSRVLKSFTAQLDDDFSHEYRIEHGFRILRNQEVRQSTDVIFSSSRSRPVWSEARVEWILYFR